MKRDPKKADEWRRRSKRIRKRSTKMASVYVERRKFVRQFLAMYPLCQAKLAMCAGKAVDVHEPLTRARGGSILDPSNALALCRLCHSWIHEHPKEATERGWLRRSTEVKR